LLIPPSNRLEKLSGKAKDFYSIRINNQWQIVFQWINNHAHVVKIVEMIFILNVIYKLKINLKSMATLIFSVRAWHGD
jgi:proteic killer suppression protein